MNTTPPTGTRAWADLAHHAESWRAVHLRELFANDVAREVQFVAEAPGVRYDYSRQRIGAMTLRLLSRLAQERDLPKWREGLFSGAKINNTEGRAAWHTALRSASPAREIRDALARMKALSEKIRSERKIRRIVNLGTGGSDLGPRLVADALGDGVLDVRFAANVDPKDLERALEGAQPDSTLFIVASKTFTTQETMANAMAAKAWGGKLFYAVTANTEEARGFGASEVLPMWDWVGGRFSVWSAVGLAAACAIGFDRFEEFLAGGRDIDLHFEKESIEKNVPALMALFGVWNTNFLGAATHACCPTATPCAFCPPTCSSSRWSRTASASTARAAPSTTRPRRCSGAPRGR
jgi:glucose-6-phosphate isomerase